MHNITNDDPFKNVMKQIRPVFWGAGLLSCAVNILMLTGPLFMLQVYDRVLASRSVPTLVALFGLVIALYAFLGLFDLIRNKALARAGYFIDVELSAIAKKAWIFSGIVQGNYSTRPLNDLATLRQFLSSSGLPALFDMPWVPLYLAIVYLLHTWLGVLATIGAVFVVILSVVNEWSTKKSISEASGYDLQDGQFADGTNRNAEAVIAMGMVGNVTKHWQALRFQGMAKSQLAGNRSQALTALTKATRMIVQSGILALGAYLAIHQEISSGTMIAASILAGRALGPVDQAIANSKNFIRARQARERLMLILSNMGEMTMPVQLPNPRGRIDVSNLVKFAFGSATATTDSKPILQGITFALEPGDALGVIGPSASGKSSLAKLLAGVWTPDSGNVTLDNARYNQWDRDKLGRYIGYLPQSNELLPGTIRQNIARFDESVTDDEVVEASKLAGIHELILSFPDGYMTMLISGASPLSGGQVQRIGLARAVLRTPPLVILDEPNSNLDADGDVALANAISTLRQHNSCVVVMAHRPSAIAAVNKVLMLNHGQQVEFGERDEVLRKVTKSAPIHKPPMQSANNKSNTNGPKRTGGKHGL